MNKVLLDEAVLRHLYCDENKSMYQISKELKVSIGSVYNYCKKYEIKTKNQKESFNFKNRKHSDVSKAIISRKNKGKIVSQETKEKQSKAKKIGGIGHKKERADGYITIYFPDHPRSTEEGYILEHILVMECFIGRHLKDDEVVHHVNFKKSDNRIENLMLMTKSEHMSYHSKKRWEELKNAQ